MKPRSNRTALFWAAYSGRANVVKSLLEKDDIEINFEDVDGRTPLSRAVEHRHLEVIERLLKKDGVYPFKR